MNGNRREDKELTRAGWILAGVAFIALGGIWIMYAAWWWLIS